jgi:hypothetical protein
MAPVGPLDKLDLHDDLRRDPPQSFHFLRGNPFAPSALFKRVREVREWAFLDLMFPEQFPHHGARVGTKPGTDLAREHQSVPLVITHQDGFERRNAGAITSDHEFLAPKAVGSMGH